LPLLLSRNRIVRDNWPDSFLIESSGRRETAEQIAESRARLLAERQNMKLVNSTLLEDLLGTGNKIFSSSSTVATLLSSMATTTEQEDFEDDMDTDNEDDDVDVDGAMDSSAPALDDEELEDAAAEEDEDYDLEEQEHDNSLPLSPYITKMMRLNSECSDPALLKNCLPGQKWKCINEDGRWRKHKCKFHVSIKHQKGIINILINIFSYFS